MQTEKKEYSVYIPPFDYDKRGDRLYQVWRGMLMRCFNPNSKEYYRYGGRGITMCDEWRLDYEAFKAWALPMGYDYDAPRGECTIERIENDGDYCPENCCWSPLRFNLKNRERVGRKPKTDKPGSTAPKRKRKKREVVVWEINGVTKTAKEWCAEYDINYTTVMGRIQRGMSPEEALTAEKINYYAMKRKYSFKKKKTMH